MVPSISCLKYVEEGSEIAEFSDTNSHITESEISSMTLVARVQKAIEIFGKESVALLTSFGVQSGIMLSIVAEACPDLRILHINTQGSTSEKDLAYGRKLIDTLGLKNFTVLSAECSRNEFLEGMKEVGISPETDAKNKTDYFRTLSQEVFKVSLLKRECSKSNIKCIISGVRLGQTKERKDFKFIHLPKNSNETVRFHPILDWTDEQCLEFMKSKNILPHWQLKTVLADIKRPSIEPDASQVPHLNHSLSLRSHREETKSGRECGIHVMKGGGADSNPVPPFPNVVVGKATCRFCKAAKLLIEARSVEFVELPLHFFTHLVPDGMSTVPIVYLGGKLIGGYGDLCKHFGVEDNLNKRARKQMPMSVEKLGALWNGLMQNMQVKKAAS